MKIIEGFKLRKVGTEHIVSGEGLGQVDFNRMIGLNPTAAWLWQQVEGREFDVELLADLLTQHYEVDEATAYADAKEMADEWLNAQIVK